jgi:hypothetical protein
MSTKIFELYKYTGKDIQTLYKWLEKLREKQIELQLDEMIHWIDIETDPIKRRKQRFEIERRITDETRIGAGGPFNINCSVMIYFYKKDIFVHFFGVERKLYIHNSYLKDFHYQNQTDQPNNISDEEWNIREEITDIIFSGIGIPSRCGLIFQILDESDNYMIARRMFDPNFK